MKHTIKLLTVIIFMIIAPFLIMFMLDDAPENISQEENRTYYIKELYLLTNPIPSLDTIKNYNQSFKKIESNNETLTSKENIFWVKIILNPLSSSKKYILDTEHHEILESTFSQEQKVNPFTITNNFYTSFFPNQEHVYYLKLQNHDYHNNLSISIVEENTLPLMLNFKSYFIFFIGLVFGLIFMVAIYNLALFYYNRKNAFLFYAFMQLGMTFLLLFDAHLFFEPNEITSHHLVLFVTLFALLFSRSFLETKKYLPTIDKVIITLALFIVIDMTLSLNYIIHYRLLTFIAIFILLIGFFRVKQGYTPANFFVIGWFFISFSLYTLEYAQESVMVNFLYLASPIEAIMLTLALSLQMKQLNSEKNKQTELLYHQSRLASLGDMLGSIAHQWRQPLNRLAFICMNVEKLDEKQARSQKLKEANEQLEFMSQTIDDFRNFYAPSKEKESFSFAEESQNIIDFINYKNIYIALTVKEDHQAVNYKNEFKQVLLNLLSNAKDVLEERNIIEPKISILIDKNMISIKDNAGGIKLDNIEQIFDPYFSTKEQGLGIGLYISKIIIEKNMGGKLSVQNFDDGVEFRVLL